MVQVDAYVIADMDRRYTIISCIIVIVIMEICKAPTLRLKALNKHTHIMYIEMENVINFYIYISTSVQAYTIVDVSEDRKGGNWFLMPCQP